jgi:hypothetical protein
VRVPVRPIARLSGGGGGASFWGRPGARPINQTARVRYNRAAPPIQRVKAMPSFDIVSRTKIPEVDNAIQGAMREIGTRFDFKGSLCSIERTDETILIKADDELKLKQVQELLRGYMAKRKVDVGALDFQTPEKAFGNSLRQTVIIKQGVERELAQKIVKSIKGMKVKVQVAIQGDELRVTGKKRNDLQAVITMIKDSKISQPLQYVNFRD